jgi:hypothetical protein
LDYIFELSEPEVGPAALKENVVLSWFNEAVNAGFFMLRPNRHDYKQIQDIILAKERKGIRMPYPYWDPIRGWGHKIVYPDFWRSAKGVTGTNWSWFAAFADPGLLYYWTEYVKQSVSIIIGEEIENWTSKNGTAHLERTLKGILNNCTCMPFEHGLDRLHASPPYRDFKHFSGKECAL